MMYTICSIAPVSTIMGVDERQIVYIRCLLWRACAFPASCGFQD